jgi:hypothetical protein
MNENDTNGQTIQHPCTCGFSSIVNRRLAYNSGLFYEDFIEIIGLKYECKYLYKKPLVETDQIQEPLIH